MSEIIQIDILNGDEVDAKTDWDPIDVPDAQSSDPFLPNHENDVILRHQEEDPIYTDRSRHDKFYLQWIIETIPLFKIEKERKSVVSHLRREILLSDPKTLDQEDQGGISTDALYNRFSYVQKREYKETMCVLERILWIFIFIEYKDTQTTDVIELVLVKSNLDYETYKEKKVLQLLKYYDQMKENSVKYLQWLILSGKAETYIIKLWDPKNNEWISSDQFNSDEQYFKDCLLKAIENPTLLDEVFEALFPSGSLNLLKFLLTEIKVKNIELECPILINAVYWSIYVKKENLKKSRECFMYALEEEKNNLSAQDKIYNDTALHIANDFKNKFMIRQILRKKPPIAVKNKRGLFPISNISRDDLSSYLDSLITEIPSKFLTSLDIWRIIKGIYIDEYNLSKVFFLDLNTFLSKDKSDKIEFHDLDLFKEIIVSHDLKSLIDHPVIAILLELHWMKFKYWKIVDHFSLIYVILVGLLFFIKNKLCNQIIYYLTLVIILIEILKNYKVFVKLFKLFQVGICNIRNRVVQIIRYSFNCLRKFQKHEQKNNEIPDETDDTEKSKSDEENDFKTSTEMSFPLYGSISSLILKLPLLIMMSLFGHWNCSQNIDSCRAITGIGVILLSLNISFLMGYFSRSFAINFIMLVKVGFTGLKFIFSTFLILLGFAISLITLINKYGIPQDDDDCIDCKNSTLTEENDETEEIPVSTQLGLGIFKTIIMSTGEYEAGELVFSYITSYVVFICFVFTIPIVFINLLNALAIEDVKEIKKASMMWYRRAQLIVLYEFESLARASSKFFCSVHITTDIYPELIGENAFIGIRKTTREVFSMNDVDNHEQIGVLTRNVIQNAVDILNKRDDEEED